jgi:hypothetical protein
MKNNQTFKPSNCRCTIVQMKHPPPLPIIVHDNVRVTVMDERMSQESARLQSWHLNTNNTFLCYESLFTIITCGLMDFFRCKATRHSIYRYEYKPVTDFVKIDIVIWYLKAGIAEPE